MQPYHNSKSVVATKLCKALIITNAYGIISMMVSILIIIETMNR